MYLYNGNVQQNPLCAVLCVTKDIHISPRFSPTIFYRQVNSALEYTEHQFFHTSAQIDAPWRLAHYARYLKCLFVLHSTAAQLTTVMDPIFLPRVIGQINFVPPFFEVHKKTAFKIPWEFTRGSRALQHAREKGLATVHESSPRVVFHGG